MIEANEIFSDSDKRIALWCNGGEDTSDLAILSDNIIENKVSLISVPSKNLSFIWTCLEKSGVKIFSRYFFEPSLKNIDNDVSEFATRVISDCKSGADGVQVFIKMRDFERFLVLLSTIRDDLFFGHSLSLCMDVQDIDVNNWGILFDKLRDIRADSFGVSLNEDMGNRSDFIGRIYGMLDNWNFDGELHFFLGNNFDRIDQVIRLVESMRPELSDKIRFFLEC